MLEKIQGISGESLKCQVCCCGHFLTVSHSDHAYVAGIMKQIAPFFKVHLSICCSDAPVACICPSCGCLQKDSFHLTVATQLHTKCKHNNLCNLCYLMPNKHANQCIFIFFIPTWRMKSFEGGAVRWLPDIPVFFLPSFLPCMPCLAGTAAGQFTLSGYACKECPLFVPILGPQPSSPLQNLSHTHMHTHAHTVPHSPLFYSLKQLCPSPPCCPQIADNKKRRIAQQRQASL